MDKENVLLFSLKKKNPLTYNNMDEPGEHMLSEMSQAQKDKYCII